MVAIMTILCHSRCVCVMMFFTRLRTILLKKFLSLPPIDVNATLRIVCDEERRKKRICSLFLCQWLALHLRQNHENTIRARGMKKKRKERRDNEFFCTFITWSIYIQVFHRVSKNCLLWEGILFVVCGEWDVCMYVCMLLKEHKYYSFINDLYLTISINLCLCTLYVCVFWILYHLLFIHIFIHIFIVHIIIY